ncbi:MAG: right-handed parallel beta-helix repeat-containing protein [Eubacterium sp.]|nr:right-handed parallel beta-helix repeat-containing protein [Eubacterium sp.]
MFHKHTNIFYSGGACCSEAIQIDLSKHISVFPLFGSWDNTPCTYVTVKDCYFSECGNGVGSHAFTSEVFHQSIKIINNFFYNLEDAAVKSLYWTRANIRGNTILIINNGSGIQAVKMDNSIISNNTIHDTESNGIIIKNSENLEVNGGEIKYCDSHGISIVNGSTSDEKTKNVLINGLEIRHNGVLGVELAADLTYLHNCNISDNGSHGVYVYACTSSEIAMCDIKNNTGHGVTATGSTTISNTVKDCTFVDNNTDVLVGNQASKNVVKGNVFFGSKTSGYNIWIQNGTTNNVVAFNEAKSSSRTTRFNDASTTTKKDFNFV